MRVLLADDDEDQLHLRALLLQKSGFETFQALDSAAAALLAARHKPQCAVVDLRFPTQKAGLALIRTLKALDPAMRIIVLTGGSATTLARLPEKDLVYEVIIKGASSAQLVKKLREAS